MHGKLDLEGAMIVFSPRLVNEDPFVLTELPNVYFAGNQPKYETLLRRVNEQSACRLICVPSFRITKSIVLIDL